MYKSNEPAKVMGVIEKNSAEEIRFAIVKWHEKNYVDVRVWIKADPSEYHDEIPTKRGIRFSFELLPEIIEQLKKIDAELGGGPEEPEKTEEGAMPF